MKTELENQDIEAIAQRVIDLLRPYIDSNGNHETEDKYMTVKQASSYIGLSAQWIHNNLKHIPHINLGNKPLFKKSDIDKYLEQFRKVILSDYIPGRPGKLPVIPAPYHPSKTTTKKRSNNKFSKAIPIKQQVPKAGAFKNQKAGLHAGETPSDPRAVSSL